MGLWPRKCGVWSRKRVAFGPRRNGGLGLPPPPLAGEGWGGGGTHALVLSHTPSLSLPRKRGRERTESAGTAITPGRRDRSWRPRSAAARDGWRRRPRRRAAARPGARDKTAPA